MLHVRVNNTLHLLSLREGRGGGRHQDVPTRLCQLTVPARSPQIHVTLPAKVPVLQRRRQKALKPSDWEEETPTSDCTSGLEVAQDMICSSIPDIHLLLSWEKAHVRCYTGAKATAAAVNLSRPHHDKSHFILGHGLQVGHREGFGEAGASSQRLGRLHRGREAVQPGPLAGTPGSGSGLGGTVSQSGRHGGATQEVV